MLYRVPRLWRVASLVFYKGENAYFLTFFSRKCANVIQYGHSGDFRHTSLCFYNACGIIRHTEYGNNSHTSEFHTDL